jgi:hypothetical protein
MRTLVPQLAFTQGKRWSGGLSGEPTPFRCVSVDMKKKAANGGAGWSSPPASSVAHPFCIIHERSRRPPPQDQQKQQQESGIHASYHLPVHGAPAHLCLSWLFLCFKA